MVKKVVSPYERKNSAQNTSKMSMGRFKVEQSCRESSPPQHSGVPSTSESLENPDKARPRVIAKFYIDQYGERRIEMSPSMLKNKEVKEYGKKFWDLVLPGLVDTSTPLKRGPNKRSSNKTHRRTTHIEWEQPLQNISKHSRSAATSKIELSTSDSHLPSDLEDSWESRAQHLMEPEDEKDHSEEAPAGNILTELKIGDEAAIEDFYQKAFEAIQQLPCKAVAKAWIKLVEPKKQAHYPYNGGPDAKAAKMRGETYQGKAPEWWPIAHCRHREPDHIRKQERITLLINILTKLMHLGVTCEKLENAATDCVPVIKEELRGFLEDVFHARRQQERYLRGEVDSTYSVYVRMPSQPTKSATKRSRAKQPTCNTKRAKPVTSSSAISSQVSKSECAATLESSLSSITLHKPTKSRKTDTTSKSQRKKQIQKLKRDPTTPSMPSTTVATSSFSSMESDHDDQSSLLSSMVPSSEAMSNRFSSSAGSSLAFLGRNTDLHQFAIPQPIRGQYQDRSVSFDSYVPSTPQEACWPSNMTAPYLADQQAWAYLPSPVSESKSDIPLHLTAPSTTDAFQLDDAIALVQQQQLQYQQQRQSQPQATTIVDLTMGSRWSNTTPDRYPTYNNDVSMIHFAS